MLLFNFDKQSSYETYGIEILPKTRYEKNILVILLSLHLSYSRFIKQFKEIINFVPRPKPVGPIKLGEDKFQVEG